MRTRADERGHLRSSGSVREPRGRFHYLSKASIPRTDEEFGTRSLDRAPPRRASDTGLEPPSPSLQYLSFHRHSASSIGIAEGSNSSSGSPDRGARSSKRPIAVMRPFEDTPAAVMLAPGDTLDNFRDKIIKQLAVPLPPGQSLPLVDGQSGEPIKGIAQVWDAQWLRLGGLSDRILTEITGPTPRPFIGNVGEFLGPDPKGNLKKLFHRHGPLIRIVWPSGRGSSIMTNDAEVVELLTEESRYFTKRVAPEQRIYWGIKQLSGNGLFTSSTSDDDWQKAHKILMPAFSAKAIITYTSEMCKIGLRAAAVLENFAKDGAPLCEISPVMTQLTLESVTRCGFSYDFGLLDPNNISAPPHTFVQCLQGVLSEIVARAKRPEFANKLKGKAKFDQNIHIMRTLVSDVIAKRRVDPNPEQYDDMLQYMLSKSDPVTGESMSNELIRDNTLVFLIAGHETTSSLLSFCLFRISTLPEVEAKILAELKSLDIDNTTEQLSMEQVKQLKYLDRVISETLRLHPPVPVYSKWCLEDALVTSRNRAYKVTSGQPVIISTDGLHGNPLYWPEPEKFDPDRFLPENIAKRHPHAWMPFSSGLRGCIGRHFSMRESKIFLALLMARFTFETQNPEKVTYTTSTGITTHPKFLLQRIRKRTWDSSPLEVITSEESILSEAASTASPHSLSRVSTRVSTPLSTGLAERRSSTSRFSKSPAPISVAVSNKATSILSMQDHLSLPSPSALAQRQGGLPPIQVVYGSNSGTCEDLAYDLSSVISSMSFSVTTNSLNDFVAFELEQVQAIASDTLDARVSPLVIFVVSTYNGFAPDNAAHFDKYLSASFGDADSWDGIRYAVFGSGSSDWQTFQGFPSRVDSRLQEMGGTRWYEKGSGDADDLEFVWRDWTGGLLAQLLLEHGIETASTDPLVYGRTVAPGSIKVEVVEPEDAEYEVARSAGDDACMARLTRMEDMHDPKSVGGKRTLDITIDLPEDMRYETGDHLELWPQNETQLARRLAVKLGMAPEAAFRITDRATLPHRSMGASIRGPCTIERAFIHHADLLRPAPRSMLHGLAECLAEEAPIEAAELRHAIEGDSISATSAGGMREDFVTQYPTVLDVLWRFGKAGVIQLADLLGCVPGLQSRRYSIASSPNVHPHSARLCIRLVSRRAAQGFVIDGQASGFLRRSQVGQNVRAAVRRSAFKPSPTLKPESSELAASSPSTAVLVGAGTGIAPFVGFLEERQYKRRQRGKVSSVNALPSPAVPSIELNGDKVDAYAPDPSSAASASFTGTEYDRMVLYYGCRTEADCLFAERLKEWVDDGTLDELRIVKSRVPDSPHRYVGDALLADSLKLWQQRESLSFMICGAAGTMARDVRKTIQSIGTQFRSARTGGQQASWIDELVESNRYHEDVW